MSEKTNAVARVASVILPLVEIAYTMRCPSCGGDDADVILRDDPKHFGKGLFNCGKCGSHSTLNLRYVSALADGGK